MNYYFQALKKYGEFKGRANRKEFWYFLLINVIISLLISFLDYINIRNELLSIGGKTLNIPILGPIYSLAVIIPGIAIAVRRMHDVNKNGWYILIPIYNLILACTAGTKGNNEFGPEHQN